MDRLSRGGFAFKLCETANNTPRGTETMLKKTELPHEPVALEITGTEGHRHRVSVERKAGGEVRIACSCAFFERERWCRHVVDVLCMRLRALGVPDEDAAFRLEEAVMGTAAEDQAHALDCALIAYERALAAFDHGRSASLAGDVVDTMAGLSRAVADAATELHDAVIRFRRVVGEAP